MCGSPVYLEPIRNSMQKPIGMLLFERIAETKGLFGLIVSFRESLTLKEYAKFAQAKAKGWI
jgi:hypothetical protein